MVLNTRQLGLILKNIYLPSSKNHNKNENEGGSWEPQSSFLRFGEPRVLRPCLFICYFFIIFADFIQEIRNRIMSLFSLFHHRICWLYKQFLLFLCQHPVLLNQLLLTYYSYTVYKNIRESK